jgi:hypothetical protein
VANEDSLFLAIVMGEPYSSTRWRLVPVSVERTGTIICKEFKLNSIPVIMRTLLSTSSATKKARGSLLTSDPESIMADWSSCFVGHKLS